MLMKELTQHCMLMIQPQLHAYSVESWEDSIVNIQPTVLDVQSIVPGCVLFLDTYFYLVVYHGNDIARWRQEGCACTLYLMHCQIQKHVCTTTFSGGGGIIQVMGGQKNNIL